MPLRSNNTFEEMLSKTLQLVSEMKQAPDADLEWIVGLETMVLSKLREPIDRMNQLSSMPAGQGGAPGGMPPGMGGQGGMVGGMGTSTLGPGGPQPGAVPGVMQGSPAPNPDELRRLIGNLQ